MSDLPDSPKRNGKDGPKERKSAPAIEHTMEIDAQDLLTDETIVPDGASDVSPSEYNAEVDSQDLIVDIDPDDLLPEDDSHLERAIDGLPSPDVEDEDYDPEEDLEDDDFLEQIALGTTETPAISSSVIAESAEEDLSIPQDSLEAVAEADDDDFLEQIALGTTETPAISSPIIAEPVEVDLNIPQVSLEAVAEADDEVSFVEIGTGDDSPTIEIPRETLDSEIAPESHPSAVMLDSEQFEKELQELDPFRMLEKKIKPIRLYTSVPAVPIPDPEFPLT